MAPLTPATVFLVTLHVELVQAQEYVILAYQEQDWLLEYAPVFLPTTQHQTPEIVLLVTPPVFPANPRAHLCAFPAKA